MNWREYESAVFEFFKRRFQSARVRHDVRLPGRLSGTKRQIDVLVEQEIGGLPFVIVVDCKAYNKRLDVTDVGAFIDLLEDVGATRGVLITTLGYSEAARARAKTHTRCQLQVLNFESLASFQDFWGMPYTGRHAVVVSAPSGWVIDNEIATELKGRMLCTLYPQEFSRAEAFERRQAIYFNIFTERPPRGFNGTHVDWLVALHDLGVRQTEPNADISYWEEANGTNRRPTLFRRIDYGDGGYLEFCGFNATRTQVSYAVLITTAAFQTEDLARLRYVMSELVPMEIQGKRPANTHPLWRAAFEMLTTTE